MTEPRWRELEVLCEPGINEESDMKRVVISFLSHTRARARTHAYRNTHKHTPRESGEILQHLDVSENVTYPTKWWT